ncbi:hypothetical protein HDU80_007636 [Chytriomyces hyalinus]|nr:hypothetical protein HDU80_007636 [Chytriomyces hyalinus]
MDTSAMNSTRTVDEKTIGNLAQLLSHFEVLIGVLTILMTVAMNALIVCLNRGDQAVLLNQKNFLLCAMLLSNAAIDIISSFLVLEESQPPRIGLSIANACGKIAFISFTWLLGCVPVLAAFFATVPSRMSVHSTTSMTSSIIVVFLDSYFAVIMGKHLMNRSAVELKSRDIEGRNINMYHIVARHQFAASLCLFCAVLCGGGKTAVEDGDRSPVSVYVFYGLSGFYALFVFVALVVTVRMKAQLLFFEE